MKRMRAAQSACSLRLVSGRPPLARRERTRLVHQRIVKKDGAPCRIRRLNESSAAG